MYSRHDIAELLLNLALSIIQCNQSIKLSLACEFQQVLLFHMFHSRNEGMVILNLLYRLTYIRPCKFYYQYLQMMYKCPYSLSKMNEQFSHFNYNKKCLRLILVDAV